MSNPSLISPTATTGDDAIEHRRPIPINTSFDVSADGNQLPQVTPTQSETLLKLFDCMDSAFTWKIKITDSEEKGQVFPIKQHLQETQTNRQSLKELLCSNYKSLKWELKAHKLKDYNLSVKLLLLSLGAVLSGLREDYQIDQWELVSSVWCSGVSSDDLKEVCFEAGREFLFDHQYASKTSEMDETTRNRVSSFWEECKGFMTSKRESNECFIDCLTRIFCGETESLFGCIFTGEETPSPAKWDIQTKIFVFAMMSLCVDGNSKKSIRKTVSAKVAGYSERQFTRFLVKNKLLDAALLVEEIDRQIVVPPEQELDDDDESRVKEIDRQIVVPPEQELIVDDASTVDESKVQDAEQAVVDWLNNAIEKGPGLRTPEMNQLLEKVAHHVLQEKKGDNLSICELEYKSANGRKIKTTYVHLPEPRKNKPYSQLRRTAQNEKANILVEVVEHLAGDDEDEQRSLVSKFLDKFGDYVVFVVEEFKFTLEEIALLRSRIGLTLNQLVKWDQCERALKGNTRFPKQFKKVFSAFEKEDSVPVNNFEAELELNGSKGLEKVGFTESKCPQRLLERSLKAAKLTKTFEESETFSSLPRTIFVPFGCDKDNDQTSMMMRVANRERGNSNQHVASLSWYERAKECYDNLRKSILREDGLTQPFLQKVVDNRFFTLEVSTTDLTGNLIDCECVILELFSNSDYRDGDLYPEMTVDLVLGDDEYCDRENFKEEVTCPEEFEIQIVGLELGDMENIKDSDGNIIDTRFKPSDVDKWKTGKRLLKIALVADLCEGRSLDDSYYGYRLYEGHKNDETGAEEFETKPCFVGLLEKPVHRKFEDGLRKCEIQQVVGIHSADMKNAWNVKGMMDGANASYSCIVCTQPKNTYKHDLPSWARKRLRKLNPNDKCLHSKLENMKDYHQRNGIYANHKTYAKFIEKHGGEIHNYALSKAKETEATHESYGTVRPPLLRIHPSKENMGALHLSAGLGNHFKDQLDKQLMEIDIEKVGEEMTFQDEVEEANGACKQFLADRDDAYKRLTKANREQQKRILSYGKIVERARGPNRLRSMNDDAVQSAEDELVALKNSSQIKDYRQQTCLRNGATELVAAVEPYRKSKRVRGPGQSTFRRAVQMHCGQFNAQHGGMELSNAACLRMLETFDDISRTVRDAYEFEPEAKRKKVEKLMDKAEDLARSLFKLCKLLKSQKKWDDEMIEAFEEHAYSVFVKWSEIFPQGIFPKMHSVLWHVIEFVRKYGAFGRFSEESFESRHVVHKKEASFLKSVKNLDARLTIFARRVQANINVKYQKAYLRLTEFLTGKKRQKYNKKNINRAYATVLQYEAKESDGVLFVSNDKAIKKEWAEVYYFLIDHKEPESWNHPFVKRVQLDEEGSQNIFASNT